jgi:hypothetical protein
MPYYPPDTPPEPPGQMPQASTPGPAPVPYAGGTDQRPEPPVYSTAPPLGPDGGGATTWAVADYPAGVTPSALAAPNPNPYEAGSPSPVTFPGDADPGGRDIVSGTVAGAVAAAQARFGELAGDTYTQGSHVGDLMKLPPGPLDPGVGSLGETLPAGHYYTPPREYGDEPA